MATAGVSGSMHPSCPTCGGGSYYIAKFRHHVGCGCTTYDMTGKSGEEVQAIWQQHVVAKRPTRMAHLRLVAAKAFSVVAIVLWIAWVLRQIFT
jgi:hypothetical protein